MMHRRRSHFWIGPALLLAGLTVVALLARPLTPIDETRYASVAWEMWLRGDYLVLFKNGVPYSHKPPLLFWLYNLGWAVFGVNEWWPRLISPLFSFGSLLLTASIARRLWPYEPQAERNALWILASCLLWMAFSTTAMFDVLLSFFVLLGIRGLLIAADESRWRGFASLALAIGFGVLAKGPVILLHLLPVAVLVFWWRPEMNRKGWFGGILLAVLAGALIALAWAIPAAISGGETYRNAIFWGQTANRMVDSFAHRRPFWWYVPLLPIALFPWLIWPRLWQGFAGWRRNGLDQGLRFCLAWMLPVFIAFSLISGKQPHYIVPLIPGFALLAGRVLASTERASVRIPAVLLALAGVALIYFAVVGLPGKSAVFTNLPVWPGVALVILCLWAMLWSRRDFGWLTALAVLGAGFFALLQAYIAQNALARYDMHPIAREIRALQDKGIAVANYGNYHAQYQFAGRLLKPLEMVDGSLIAGWQQAHPHGVVVMYFSDGKPSGEVLFSQPYRGGVVVLKSASQAAAMGGSAVEVKTDSVDD